MADVGVKFTVVADTREAKGELNDLEKAAERVQNASGRGGGGGGGGNPSRPGGDGEEFGKAAGKQIGKALAGFMAREASGIIFAEMRRRGMGGDRLDIAQAAVGGALAFGTTGAMLGGPWGALIGGGLGAAAGGIKAWQEKEENKRKSVRALYDDIDVYNRSFAASAEAMAVKQLISLTPKADRGLKIGLLQSEVVQAQEAIRKNLADMIYGGETDTPFFKELSAKYNSNRSLLGMLDQAGLANELESIMPATPPEIARDAFAKRGLYAGAQVPANAGTDEANRKLGIVVDVLNNIYNLTKSYISTPYPPEIQALPHGRLYRTGPINATVYGN